MLNLSIELFKKETLAMIGQLRWFGRDWYPGKKIIGKVITFNRPGKKGAGE